MLRRKAKEMNLILTGKQYTSDDLIKHLKWERGWINKIDPSIIFTQGKNKAVRRRKRHIILY